MSGLILPDYLQNKNPLQINITTHDNKLVIQFDRDVKDLALDLQEAADLLRGLNEQIQALINQNRSGDYSLN
jgi:hypothetical protein